MKKTAEQDDVLYALKTLRSASVSASKLMRRLEDLGYTRQSSQLAMQRAVDAGALWLRRDYRLSLPAP